MSEKQKPKIIVIGQDTRLIYLLTRYATKAQVEIIFETIDNLEKYVDKISKTDNLLLFFLSITLLENVQTFIDQLNRLELPIFVCSSLSEILIARKLGADECLQHPCSYEEFYSLISNYLIF